MSNQLETIKSFMGKGGTPQQLIFQLMQSNMNPMMSNLLQKAQTGDAKAIEDFARNVFKEKGRDFDKEFSEFMSNFK